MTDIQNILPIFKNKLMHIVQDESQSILERKTAQFYLDIIKPYDYKNLIRQKGFGRGIGGSGDNIVVMPVIERDENGQIIQNDGNIRTVSCVFDDFKSYLDFIEDKRPIRKSVSHWRTLPISVNGMTQDDYTLIWQRFQGLVRE